MNASHLREIAERVIDIVYDTKERTLKLAEDHHGEQLSRQVHAVLDIMVIDLKMKLAPGAALWRELAARPDPRDEDVQ